MVSIMQTLESVVMTRERKMLGALTAVGTEVSRLSLAKIKGAFEINNIRRGCVTCYMDDI